MENKCSVTLSDLSSSSSSPQLELPVETVTSPTPQSHESGRVDENLIDSKLLLEPWNELPDLTLGSPGGRGVTSVLGPQTPTGWLYEAESTQAPVSTPPPPPPLTDSPLPGKGGSRWFVITLILLMSLLPAKVT